MLFHRSARRLRRASGRLCLAAGLATTAFSTAAKAATTADDGRTKGKAKSSLSTEAVWLVADGNKPEVIIYPPRDDTAGPKPVTVMLHGMCHAPEHECPYFAGVMTKRGWLLCPRASLTCEGGGPIWSYTKKYDTVEAAVDRVKSRYPGRVRDEDRTLMGFSLGALAAMDLAHWGNGKWQTLVLIGAKVKPWGWQLEQKGVERVLMASGERDMMRWHMFEQARRLSRRGVTSTFMGMGDVGHWFARDMDSWLEGALAWMEVTAVPEQVDERTASR